MEHRKMQDSPTGLPAHLEKSLVGSTIEYSFGKKVSSALSISGNIDAAKERIRENVKLTHSVQGIYCVTLLGEMTAYYRNEIYYMAVRSCIEMRRFRIPVLEYLNLSVSERAERLCDLLSKSKHRELVIEALRYFLLIYPNRTSSFKKYLSREEYITVA